MYPVSEQEIRAILYSMSREGGNQVVKVLKYVALYMHFPSINLYVLPS
jgi:hypothetical protein